MKLLKHVVRNMDQNVYIYFDENTKEGVVIDPGNDAEAIEKIIDDNNVDVKAILLTHGHSDHTGAANAVKKRYNIPICAHKWEVPVLDDEAISFSSMFGGEGKITVDKEFNDSDEFKFNNCTLKVIHTPGHTQGGVCYYDAEHKVLFSGDTLFYGSVGRTDFPNPPMKDGIGFPSSENTQRLLSAIKEKLYVLPDDVQVFPGHGGASRIGFEKQFNPFVKG